MQDNLIHKLQDSYEKKRKRIQSRLKQFNRIRGKSSDLDLFEELVFCILAAGTSARMALESVNALKNILFEGDYNQIKNSLAGYYRYPNMRSYHIICTREYLKTYFDFSIKKLLESHNDNLELRKYLALNKNIVGIGFKEASHYLRNIGYCGFAILDKHIVRTLYELQILKENRVPTDEKTYLDMEDKFKKLSYDINIDMDELDLLLWSEKSGEILK